MTWLDTQPQEKVATALARYRTTPSMHTHDGGDERFGLWLALVNNRLIRTVGLGLFDLGDWPIRDAYDNGDSPSEAARLALSYDDTYGALA